MRTLLLVFLVCPVLWSQPQKPPESTPTTKAHGAESTQEQKESSKGQRPADGKAKATTADEQAESIPSKRGAQTKTNEELETNRRLALFTGLLVGVGVVQFLALLWQATALRSEEHTPELQPPIY